MTSSATGVERSEGTPSAADGADLPTLELRVPISPADQDMRMIRYLLESIQAFGGPISRAAHCAVSVSAEGPLRDLKREYPWCADYSIEFHWLDEELFRRHKYDATGFHRLWVESNADVVAQVDVDLLVAGDFDDVIARVHREQLMLGCLAHVSPFDFGAWNGTSQSAWIAVFREAGLPEPHLDWVHPAWGLMSDNPDHRCCPAYYNYGVVFSPRSFAEQMGRTFLTDLGAVERVADSWAKSQIAVAISIARHDFRHDVLGLNYNFPLHVACDRIRALNPDPNDQTSYEDVRVFHCLGDGEINRKHFETEESVAEILTRSELSPAARVCQRKLRTVHQRLSARVYGSS